MSKEIWKPVKGYEDLYAISSLGRVKSLPRIFFSGKNHNIKKEYPERIIKNKVYKTGYLYIVLSKGGVVKKIKIHRLVANAFIKNPLKKPFIDHINGVKHDNRVNNLRWVTGSENMNNPHTKRRLSIGKMGKQNPMKKNIRRIQQLSLNGSLIKEWSSVSEASLFYNIDTSCIYRAANGVYETASGFKWKFVH